MFKQKMLQVGNSETHSKNNTLNVEESSLKEV